MTPTAAPARSRRSWRPRPLVLVFALVLASRIPFALTTPGVGKDPDAWRLLLAGQMLVDTGEYRTSRTPGYPVVELVSAGLAGSPWWLYVLLTALVGALGVAAFADLLRSLGVRAWWWPTAALAVTPVIYRSDLTFMDYSWSLAAATGALALLARSRWVGAGAMFGLAVACRPASAVLVVGVVALLVAVRAAPGVWVRVVVPAAVVAGVFLAVPVVALGPSVESAVPEGGPPLVVAAKATTGVWGCAGVVVVLAAAVVASLRLWRGGATLESGQRAWAVAALASVVAQAGLFVLLPSSPGYLAPMVPMVLLLLALVLGARWMAVVAVVLALSAVVAPGKAALLGPTVPSDRTQRAEAQQIAHRVTDTIAGLPPGAVVIAGHAMPELLALQPRAVLADPALGGPARAWSPPDRVVLPGGQILTYEPPTTPVSGPVYRLPIVEGDAPLLPLAP